MKNVILSTKQSGQLENGFDFIFLFLLSLGKLATIVFAFSDGMFKYILQATIQITAVLPTTAVMIMEVKATSQKKPRDHDISLLAGGLGQVTMEAISWKAKEVVANFYSDQQYLIILFIGYFFNCFPPNDNNIMGNYRRLCNLT